MITIHKHFHRKIIFRCIFFLFLLSSIFCFGQPENYMDKIYSSNIKSVQFFPKGWNFSNPVLLLGEEDQLLLRFDDLTEEIRNYNYQIVHCDFNWQPSGLLESEYMTGFPENEIFDYAQSINTTVPYVNYQLLIPNDNVQLKVSGNYALIVYQDHHSDQPILVKRFYITENKVNIKANVRRGTFDTYPGEKQEISFRIEHPDYPISDSHNDIRVILRQNRFTHNEITSLRPRFSKNGILDYDYNQENNFLGGNEFRYFDLKTIKTTGENVSNISFHRPYYHATLMNDILRKGKPYYSYQDINGQFLPYYQEHPETSDTEADYIFVHFTFKIPKELAGGIHVYGELTNWTCNEESKMQWNPEQKHYELILLLKQGYYNYQYAYLPPNGTNPDLVEFEGSHFDTENDYHIFVYHTAPRSRYHRLISYRVVNSRKKN